MNLLLAIPVLALSVGQQRPATQRTPAQRATQQQQQAQPIRFDPTTASSNLDFRYIGPVGNRVSAVVGIPGNPNVYYAGAASGGIFKTTDGGVTWSSIFDDFNVASIGALAVAPSNPDIVWAGTGEPHIRSHVSVGNGVYKSTDAGRTWKLMGLEESGRVGRIAIHPTNPDIVYMAVQGHSYGPQQQRGVFRTRDGGATWERVLFVDENTGAIDIVMDPSNPNKLFAATWQLLIRTWGRESGGPGSGIHVSHDGGTTWTKLRGNGLPIFDVGKIGLAIAHSNPNRVYALIETGDGVPSKGQPTDNGELWRSEDGGVNWQVVSYDRNLACRQPYYTRMVVAPDNPDEAYFMCATFSRTLDGGRTNRSAGGGGGGGGQQGGGPPLASPGGDQHDMWIDPTNPNRMINGNDQNVAISTSRARTWLRTNLPIAQMYHVTVDNRIPYYVYGNRQDGPSYRGPSNSRTGGSIQRSEWHGVLGGESGHATPDPVDTNIIWSSASGSGARGGIVVRMDARNRHGQNVEVWPLSTGGYPAADVRYRFIWNFPILLSPHDHRKLYTVSQHVHVTTNGGRSWRVISPDLTRNDKSKQGISGGLTPDNIGVEYGGALMWIAESYVRRGILWTGSNDGKVHVTRDSGRTWTDVSPPLPAAAEWGSIKSIEPSRFDANTAYLTVDAHQEGNFEPWVFRTRDLGKTWDLIITGLPKGPVHWANVIHSDPVRRGLLYLGTENGLYMSFDDGDTWQQINNNLPPAPVYGLVVQPHFNDLVIATYGRGFWILDDVTALQRLTPDVLNAGAHLFAPRAAYRFRTKPPNYFMSDDASAGDNPPYGASINFWLRSAPQGGRVSFEVLDSTRRVVRTWQQNARAGLNRTWWDLEADAHPAPRLKTKPLFNEVFEMAQDGTRPAPGFGNFNILMPPGRYTVRMTVSGSTFTQPLEVRKDPNNFATVAEIREQVRALAAIQQDHAAAAEMVRTIEDVRAQVQAIQRQLGSGGPADVRTAADSIEQTFIDVESKILDLRMTGRGQDGVRWPVMLAGQLGYLAGTMASSDHAPTAQQREVAALLAKQTRDIHAELQAAISQELARFNTLLQQRGMRTIQVPPATP